jgi:antitoxin HicB
MQERKMTEFSYPATVTEVEPGEFIVRFVDVPEAITGAATRTAALANAPDALAVAIEAYLEAGWNLPAPRAANQGEHPIPLEPEIAARVVLQQAMREQGLTNVALAQRMNRDEKAVRRILSGKNASFALTMEALKAVGLRPALSV